MFTPGELRRHIRARPPITGRRRGRTLITSAKGNEVVMSVRVAVNGLGRTGRSFLRSAYAQQADIEVVAINDLADPARWRTCSSTTPSPAASRGA